MIDKFKDFIKKNVMNLYVESVKKVFVSLLVKLDNYVINSYICINSNI